MKIYLNKLGGYKVNVHEKNREYLLGYVDALDLVGAIIQQTTKNGLTTQGTIEMINKIIETIYHSQGLIEEQPKQVEFNSVEDILQYIRKGGN